MFVCPPMRQTSRQVVHQVGFFFKLSSLSLSSRKSSNTLRLRSDIFRCASISWFQVVSGWVSQWVIDIFLQLAHLRLRVFQIYFFKKNLTILQMETSAVNVFFISGKVKWVLVRTLACPSWHRDPSESKISRQDRILCEYHGLGWEGRAKLQILDVVIVFADAQ